jgi:two-component system NarL family sensor kinase
VTTEQRVNVGTRAEVSISRRVILTTAVSLCFVAAIVAIRASGVSDLAMTIPGSDRWFANGVTVHPVGEEAQFDAEDIVTAVGGEDLSSLDLPSAQVGQQIEYVVTGEAGVETRLVRIVPYPLVPALMMHWPSLLLIVCFLILSSYVFYRRRDDKAAGLWLLAAGTLSVGSTSWILGLQVIDLGSPVMLAVNYVGAWAYAFTWSVLVHFAALIPRRSLDQRAYTYLVRAAYAAPAILYALLLLVRLPMAETRLEQLNVVAAVGWGAERVMPIVVAVLVWTNYRRASTPENRVWLRWVFGTTLLAIGLYICLELIPISLSGRALLPAGLHTLLFLPVIVAMAAAILRYQAFDVQVIYKRSLVFAALSFVIVGLLGAGLALVSLLPLKLNAWGIFAGTTIAGALMMPFVQRLHARVRKLVYGDRDDPYAMLAHLGSSLEAALPPTTLLAEAAGTIAAALRLPHVHIELSTDTGATVDASVGHPTGEPIELELMHQGQRVGRLVASARPGEHWSVRDVRAMELLATQLAVAGSVVRLTSDLQESRRRIVVAREEERRRLKRDLHDGLGPSLAAILIALEALLAYHDQDPPRAERTLRELTGQVRDSIAEIRRLVDGLRPPALDELGLVGAIEQRVRRYNVSPGPQLRGFDVSVESHGVSGALPAAIEVAAFRIAIEAVYNASKHSGATLCRVDLTFGTELRINVIDDGHGLVNPAAEGAGLASMRERAAETGGWVDVSAAHPSGTKVLAVLPLELAVQRVGR